MIGKTLEIEITNKCNCTCAMCPREAMTRPLGEMEESTFQLLVSRAIAAGIKNIGFAGFGEPLLNKRIVSFVRYAKQKDPSLHMSFSTNAALLTEQIARQLLEAGLDRFTVSFDGGSVESHRELMGKSFEKTVQNIVSVHQLTQSLGRGRLNLAPILMKKQTETDIENIYTFFREQGLGNDNFPGHYLIHNRAGYFADNDLVDDEFLASRHVLKYPAADIICTWALTNNWIDWQGRHHLCCNDIQDQVVLGHISDMDFTEAARLKRNLLLKGTPGLCRNCDFPFTLGYKNGFIFRSDLPAD